MKKSGTLAQIGVIGLALAGAATLSSCCGLGLLAHTATVHGHCQHAQRQESAAPAQIGDQVVCPVDGMKVSVTTDTPSTEFQGRSYYFCSDADQRAFLKQPERYTAHH